LIKANELPSNALGNRRWINVPGISVTAGEMADALERVAGPDVARRIRWARDERIEKMVLGWPAAIDNERALQLGFEVDQNFDAIVRRYMKEDMVAPVGRGL
jgi:nucleoside-diphosphate-sugar epimerase